MTTRRTPPDPWQDSINPEETLTIFTPAPSPRARRSQLFAELVLVVVAFFWGATFAVVKRGVELSPVYWFLTMRFAMAAVPLWVLAAMESRDLRSRGRVVDRGAAARAGAWLGVLLFGGYAMQTLGLRTTEATKSAFITGMVSLWTPLMVVWLWRRRPRPESLMALPVGVIGLFLLVFGVGGSELLRFRIGDLQTLICSIFFAAQIVAMERLTVNNATGWLAASQITTVAVLSAAASIISGESMRLNRPAEVWVAITVCALFATTFAFWAQARMQRHTTAERAAIIFLLEPVFGAMTAFALLGETLAGAQWVGAALIFVAIVAQEAWSFIRRRMKNVE